MRQPRGSSTHRGQVINRPKSLLEWGDEKLAQLDVGQLKNLLENLGLQCAMGRVSAEDALDLSQRITARLPARALGTGRTRPRVLVQLDTRIAKELGDFAARLGREYDLSDATAREQSMDVAGFRPEAGPDKRGLAKQGTAVKKGDMSIDRSISYRVRDSLASLAYLLLPDQPHETGRYVILATDDLLESGVPIADVVPASRTLGWSRDRRARMRAQATQNFKEAQALYEGLIARLATKHALDE